MNAHSPNKWRSTLKSAVFSLNSSLAPLVSRDGGLVCESLGKADLLSDHFDCKQSRESDDLPLTCHPSPSLHVEWGQASLVRLGPLWPDHLGIQYKLCSVGIGGSVLSILTQFLSNRSQHVMADGCRSKLVKVVSGVPQGHKAVPEPSPHEG